MQRYTRLTFDSYIAKSIAKDKITNNMCQGQSCLVVIGGAQMPQGLTGHHATPETRKFISYFKRRKNCDVLLMSEFRTSMLCSICHRVMTPPNNQPKARYFTCRDCNVARGGTSADVIHTKKSRRQLQKLRKAKWQRQPNQQQQPNQQPNQNGNQNGNGNNARLISKTVRIVKTNQAQRLRYDQAKAKAKAKEANKVR